MTKSLPSRPNLEQLKNQAKDLLKSLKSDDPDAIQRVRENHPRWSATAEPEMDAAALSLGDAQVVIAREYGFASWPTLMQRVVGGRADLDCSTAPVQSWPRMRSSAARWWMFMPRRAWA